MNFLRHIIVYLIVGLLSVSVCADGINADCFTLIVGKKASDQECVILAHNEDDGGGNIFVNVQKVPPSRHGNKNITLKNGAAVSLSGKTVGVLWLSIAAVDFGDSFINEKGVVIASNACPSRENKPDITNGGIGLMLRRLVARQATTAREAVKLAGKLIETYGYYSSGRSYAIADPNEGWLLQVVKGKHWIAQRVPDDEVAVISNCYTIGEINLKDKDNFMGSPDIVKYATDRGWYDPKKDGPFHFARVYAAPGNIRSEVNALRQWRGISFISKKKFKPEGPFPFSLAPNKAVRTTTLFRILRDHYEDTEFDLTDGYKNGSPNSTKKRTICTDTTRYSLVAELRDDLPGEIAPRVWIAFRRPDSNAYSPWYPSLLTPPAGYDRGNGEEILLNAHYKQPHPFSVPDLDYAYWCYDKLSQLVDQNYRSNIKQTRKKWNNYEAYTMKRIRRMEKEFRYQLELNQHIALKIITNYVHNTEFRKWFLSYEQIGQMVGSK